MGLYRRKDSPYIWWTAKIGGKRFNESTGTFDRRLADRVYMERRHQLVECQNFPTSAGKYVTLKEMAAIYVRDHAKVNKRSWARDERTIRYLLAFFGDVPLVQITPQRIEQFKSHRKGHVKDSSVNRELACLKTIFGKAVKWGYTAVNPVKAVEFFKEEEKPITVLTREQRGSLLSYLPEWLRRIVIMALKTGMRKGEILALRWENVDLSLDIITVVKTKASRTRKLPIHPELREVLLVLSDGRRGDLVFCDDEGKPLRAHGGIRTAFESAAKKAGMEKFTFHDLRHNFASECVARGIDLATVREYLGHSTLKMTQRYTHVGESTWRSSIQLLGRDTPTVEAHGATPMLRGLTVTAVESGKVL